MGWEVSNNWSKTRLSGITLGGTWLLTIEDAKALGGGCKSFIGCYQHVDKQLRFYSELGGIIMVLPEDEIAATRERTTAQGNESTLSKLTGAKDLEAIKTLFKMTKLAPDTIGEEKYEIFFTTRAAGRGGTNSFRKERWKVERTKPVNPYLRKELEYEEPDITYLSIKF